MEGGRWNGEQMKGGAHGRGTGGGEMEVKQIEWGGVQRKEGADGRKSR